jgi:hypothetical protein
MSKPPAFLGSALSGCVTLKQPATESFLPIEGNNSAAGNKNNEELRMENSKL